MKQVRTPIPRTAPAGYGSAAARWNAVRHRDPKADGHFFYSVYTTGVYCRPSCGARLAGRNNVQFHTSWEAAERAGYRACKRCRPKGPSLLEGYAAKVAVACRTIATAAEFPGLMALAKAAGMGRYHFHRVFTQLAGVTPKAYAMAQRAERLRTELPHRRTVTEAIYAAGFNSNSRFYAAAARMLGMAPRRFRLGGLGEVIRFARGKCSFGAILVAASEKGICAILLGDDPAKLHHELQTRFPKAQLIRGDRKFGRVVASVVGFVEAPETDFALPLDVRGTAFQQRVWKALVNIPVGSTASYAAIAARIRAPKAGRAVAGACAANALAVAIPCHRVVRTDGSLSGYRWGVKRKQALLQREAAGGRRSNPSC